MLYLRRTTTTNSIIAAETALGTIKPGPGVTMPTMPASNHAAANAPATNKAAASTTPNTASGLLPLELHTDSATTATAAE